MKYGICGPLEFFPLAARAGYDYMESGVGGLLRPLEDDAAFAAALATMSAAALPSPVLNGFLPQTMKITGPSIDMPAVQRYVASAFRRAEQAGVDTIVFGSQHARRVPDGFDRAAARAQIVDFCRMLAPIALEHGVTVVIEPLNRNDCNIINTIRQAASIAREVDHPAVRLLADAYHLLKDNDSLDDLVENGDLLRHVHVGTVPHRLIPGAEPCDDLAGFFRALVRAGYDGRVSVECMVPEPEVSIPRGIAVLRQLEADAGKDCAGNA